MVQPNPSITGLTVCCPHPYPPHTSPKGVVDVIHRSTRHDPARARRNHPMTDETMHGRVALITGAGRGIGREIALGLAARGAAVALVSRTSTELEQVAAEVHSRGGTALVVPGDVADATQVEQLLTIARSALGH